MPRASTRQGASTCQGDTAVRGGGRSAARQLAPLFGVAARAGRRSRHWRVCCRSPPSPCVCPPWRSLRAAASHSAVLHVLAHVQGFSGPGRACCGPRRSISLSVIQIVVSRHYRTSSAIYRHMMILPLRQHRVGEFQYRNVPLRTYPPSTTSTSTRTAVLQ